MNARDDYRPRLTRERVEGELRRERHGGELHWSRKVLADGRKLKRLREDRGVSVAELSERSGISTSTIYALQRGPTNRTWAEQYTLEKLAKALGTSQAALRLEERRGDA